MRGRGGSVIQQLVDLGGGKQSWSLNTQKMDKKAWRRK